MHTALHHYLKTVNNRYQAGNATEHTYRGDLEQLISAIAPKVQVTNEPTRSKCGAPDYIITAGDIPIGYIEAKDIGKPLNSKEYKEQFDRYKAALDNLIITDYLEFQFFIDGKLVDSIAIADIQGGKVVPLPEKFAYFEALITNFCSYHGQTIRSSVKLAEMMANKAKMLANVIENALTSDEETNANSTLKDQMHAFKEILIHDIKPREFADIYAQTIAYGMFAARLHDASLPTFTRQEAAELIPKTNPFLRKLFSYIAGPDIDDRIKWIVDALADIFRATDVAALLKNFGKSTQQNDPIIHFYETFLSEYDPKLRKSRGVWYTPEPVVNFIVRAVDDILKTEFSLPTGLADTSKIKIKVDAQGTHKKVEKEVHRVQILDPATGTGTFLAEVVKQIHQNFEGQQGLWSSYVEDHLIPRLNGFELLMASYAMAHLKLDMLLTETGYKPKKEQRLNVYLTNSLEEPTDKVPNLFMAQWLSEEAIYANRVKNDTPVMVVLGNPPYSVSSTNKGEWIESLLADYKTGLPFKNIQPLSDDYIKFIRFGQNFIEKNGEGILAFICNNSFLDGLIHQKMRLSLMQTFDKIYVLDLHGNHKKLEVDLSGNKDENVFDIQQGVSINIFLKTKAKIKEQGQVFLNDLLGKREAKYEFLEHQNLYKIKWKSLIPNAPQYFYKEFNEGVKQDYQKLLPLNSLFKANGAGVQTKRDNLFMDFEDKKIQERISSLLSNRFTNEELTTYNVANSSSYRLLERITKSKFDPKKVVRYNYRTFDFRFLYYDENLLGRAFFNIMKHMVKGDNMLLITCKQQSSFDFQHIFITDLITDHNSISLQTREASYCFPLYLYPDNTQLNLDGHMGRVPNLNMDMVQQIAQGLGLEFVPEKPIEAAPLLRDGKEAQAKGGAGGGQFAPIDLLDYIYAVLHSPAYREKYKEFLKIDFPRVPYPTDAAKFWQLVALGGQLRQLHLLESPTVSKYITQYPEDGDNTVDKPRYEGTEKGRVYINDAQYFDSVPRVAWEFYIGGYQPAQKWLKDRKGRTLTFEDILHYQKMIVALTETDRLMKEVDKVGVE